MKTHHPSPPDTDSCGTARASTCNEDLQSAHRLAQESARLTRIRYREGVESLRGVLESDRTALASTEQVVIAKRDLAIATARCYVAMAGGFDVAEVTKK